MAQQNDSKPASPNGKAAPDSMATSSSASDAAEKDAVTDVAAPYGTRSRNRNGNNRPNYAEDKDIEMDMYDYYPSDKKESDGGKKSSRQSNAATNGETTRANGVSRKATVDDTKNGSNQNGHRDQSSGGGGGGGGAAAAAVSTLQAAPASNAAQPSRKRKAAGGQAASASAAAAAVSAAPSKKSAVGIAVQTPPGMNWPDTNMLTFENSKGIPENGRMVADDGTVLEPNDHVYLVCEPPGEPYYLGRIMEFLHGQNDTSKPVDAVRINWYYRPKDIGRKVQDTRLVFATMHSDISPLTALRGKCQIRHRCEIDGMDDYRKNPDSFWYEKLYDRYIQKNYDLIPTRLIVNVPEKVKKVLDERWKYVLVEQGRGKELTSAVKSCKRCSGYCASNDSVDCAVCQHTYHMNCVKPPLLKKPSRGFAWSCAACSRAQERKLEARHTPNAIDHGDMEDDEFLDEDEEDARGIQTDRTTPTDDDAHHQGTAEQIYQASLWPYRYLGMHCKPEDALDYDDRIYPRASTRVGPRNQANVSPWPGQPVQYVKPLEIKKPGKKDPKLSKEALAAQEAEKARRGNRPKWIQDQPPGYVARGEDFDEDDPNCTATRLWIPPSSSEISNDKINDYVDKAMKMTKKLELPERSTNFRDATIETLFREGFDKERALKALPEIPKKEFKEPILTATEQKRFEEGISKYGSELISVRRHVKTMTPGEVVRYYYTWKKTERGQQVWGNYPGRKGKKQARQAEAAATKLADDVANDDDDSAFDAEKAVEKKRTFICQFCSTTSSRQWRRAPNAAAAGLVADNGAKTTGKDKGSQCVVALCRRCAELWRRYAIQWEDIDEVSKKVLQAGGRAWKRKQDEELLKELQVAQDMGTLTPDRASTPASVSQPTNGPEPPRKKLKSAPEKDVDTAVSDAGSVSGSAPPPPRRRKRSLWKQLRFQRCQKHAFYPALFAIKWSLWEISTFPVGNSKWTCDMCANDKSPQVSIHYKCVLCPVEHTEHDFVEQPKLTHHKKKMSDKDREREKVEVQQARKAADFYRKKQEEMNRPVNPREPLKRTADNNWVHVTCAVWTAEVKFGNAKAMEPSEGIPSIPRSKYDETCQACNQKGGACVSCHHCRAPYHVECARQYGHILGFDIASVKTSKREHFNVVTLNGESGTMSALLWCKDHAPAKTVYRIHDIGNESGLNALQLYVQNFKQADLTLTGTVRKANLMTTAAKMSGAPVQIGNRRASTTTAPSNGWAQPCNGELVDAATSPHQPGDKVCITCGIDVALRWWPFDTSPERKLTNGHNGSYGAEAQKFMEQRRFQCHKCHKLKRTLPSPEPRYVKPASPAPEPPRPQVPETALPSSVSPFRSSPSLPDYRDGRPVVAPPPAPVPAPTSHAHAWPQPPNSLPLPGPPPPPPVVHPVQPPLHSQAHVSGHRPAPVTHAYQQAGLPARTSPYPDWGHRPSSQHGSPPRHLNGGAPPPPPPLHAPQNQPPPLASLSSLRPPAMSGPPPAPQPMSNSRQHGHTSPVYANGLPPSPRQLNGPTPPAPYMPPYHGGVGHVSHGAPPHGGSHGLSNGTQPLPPPPQRGEPYSHALHPPRTQYSGSHGSPPVSRNGLPPPPHDVPPSGVIGPRPPESRPASGASASPSLRNLLS
ncbi:Lid2 complex component snt2-like protein [Cladobotryum mycophilum]|uniref:Lid2 complex component snt2-like protein n=1 Tax=Cladobotryum mycophilum TaxID=491253 RepID=A0ABR0SDW3_9HYPO